MAWFRACHHAQVRMGHGSSFQGRGTLPAAAHGMLGAHLCHAQCTHLRHFMTKLNVALSIGASLVMPWP